jgi:hypothetical protein
MSYGLTRQPAGANFATISLTSFGNRMVAQTQAPDDGLSPGNPAIIEIWCAVASASAKLAATKK